VVANAAEFPLGTGLRLEQLERDPHALLARLREREPVSWVSVLDGWLVTRHDLALRVMRDVDTFTVDDPRFSTAQVVGPSMLSLDGAAHARHRAPFVGRFRPSAVRRQFASAVAEETELLLDALEPGGEAELRRSFAGPLAARVVTRALGFDGSEVKQVLAWYDAIVAGVTGITAGSGVTPAAREAFAALGTRLEQVIDRGDPWALPAKAATAAELTRTQIVSNSAVVLFGGIETTEGMIANAVLALLEHPVELARVREDPGLIGAAIEESLRLEPAAAVVDRYATRDVRIGAASIQRGDLVTVSLAGAGRDPAVFTDPDVFDIRRPNARLHLAFAHGPHFCLGAHLARLEAQAAVHAVLSLPGLRLDPGHPNAPRGLVFRKPPALHVRWDSPAGAPG